VAVTLYADQLVPKFLDSVVIKTKLSFMRR
jgi:hypothetical protein